MYVRVSLRGILRLTRVDNLRRLHNVGFLLGRFISVISSRRFESSNYRDTDTSVTKLFSPATVITKKGKPLLPFLKSLV